MFNLVHRNNINNVSAKNEIVSTFDQIVDNFFKTDLFDLINTEGFTLSAGSYPKVDIVSYDDRLEFEAEVPGLKKEDISVEISNNILTIKGDKRQNNEKKESGKVVYKELKKSSFQRSFTLDDTFDVNSVDAKFNEGILTLTIKRKIPIQVKSEVKKIDIK